MKWIVYQCVCDQKFALPEDKRPDDASCPNCERRQSLDRVKETGEYICEKGEQQ